MKENNKEKRSNNIVIKDIDLEKNGNIDRKWVEDFIENITDTVVRAIRCRISDKILIATLEEQEIKSVVIRRKSRLKGGGCL